MGERPIDPVVIRFNDGEERKFLLSMGGVRRLKTRFKAATIKDLMDRDSVDIGIPLLYEALLDKTGIENEDALADRLPAHLEAIGMNIGKLLGVSFPEAAPNPQTASPTPTLQ